MHGNRDSIPVAYDVMGVVGRAAEWGEMNVAIENLPGGLDTAPVFAGLPDDRCQCPHWGYVVRGTFRVRGDVVEVFPAYEEEVALRISFFGDEVEQMRYFAVADQRSLGELREPLHAPACSQSSVVMRIALLRHSHC